MARSRRGAAPARRPAPAPARRPVSTRAAPPKPSAPTPAPAATPPAPMQQPSSGGGMLSGIGSTIAQGMAFGTGSAIAHQAVGAVAGSFSGGGSGSRAEEAAVQAMPPATPQQADACSMDRTNLYDCLKHNEGDTGACQFLFDQLKNCQQQAQFQQY